MRPRQQGLNEDHVTSINMSCMVGLRTLDILKSMLCMLLSLRFADLESFLVHILDLSRSVRPCLDLFSYQGF